ncbi:Ankyrin and HET domain-containing protein [Colletotrichum higginsianum IMI 349063]|uniref:Ankyrin and HET domain-containing protein n=1 Tax=Colletotrichum higginsianum (strain IMI 349063) TaxID=759273 RepID=A0A1B7XWF2_COLHI|nr:Ankyrin and HET domain-containing protein [Colletotrichum higginsianum IMI 349063]OBR04091.1 Ankyrin and HET domain-containing protein [Colletotrichum higginsianum IMI 349063]
MPIETIKPGHVGIDEIRVIKLQPAPSLVSPLVAKLAVVRIGDESVQYDALSYRWGDAGDPVSIRVNGRYMAITKSLHTALRYLRHDLEERVIWADSICINQKDTEERVAQVMDMGTIYREAACVRIWLGEEAQHSAAALSLLNNCDELQHDSEIVQRITGDAVGVDGLTEVLNRPYWSRMWMFQEITLARRAIVHCGIFTADWWTLKRLDTIIGNSSKLAGAQRGGTVHGLRKAFLNIAHFIIPLTELGSIDNVLFPTSRLEATDDRDKLSALMGVCNIGDYLMADYSKTTRETYADFTRCYSQSTGELSLLWAAGLHRAANGPNIGLPSWVPDFRGRSGKDPVFLAAGYSKVFDACAGKRFSEPRNPSRRTGWDSGVLEVEGLLIDQVTMAQPFHANEAGRMEMYRTFEVCSGGRHSSGKSRIEAFFETIIFDTDEPKSGDSDRVIDEKQGRRLQHMLGFMKDLETLQADVVPRKRNGCVDFSVLFGSEVVDHYDGLARLQPDTLEGHRKAFVKDFKYNMGSTSSLLSTRANYFGRCNDSVQTGDIVALLSGCSFPVVLRKCQSGFEFVGVAYVSGLMYGELMDGVKGSAVQGISLV